MKGFRINVTTILVCMLVAIAITVAVCFGDNDEIEGVSDWDSYTVPMQLDASIDNTTIGQSTGVAPDDMDETNETERERIIREYSEQLNSLYGLQPIK